MKVTTNTTELNEARRIMLDLILSTHNRDCLTCVRNGNCELQSLADKFGVTEIEYEGEKNKHKIDDLSPSIVRDFNKCILCRRCVSVCKKVQKIGAIDCINRGFESCISTIGDHSLNDVNCTFCGQCIEACPVGALKEKDSTQEAWEKLKDPETYVIVQTAPAVRVALGEEFGMPIGTNVTGKMVSALRRLGFDKVFDTNTGADFTIMEEGTEFIQRLDENKNLPMITSCSPGWVRYVEANYPENIKYLSSCKSPHEMFGALLKTYYAEKNNIPAEKIYVVSVMPCIAKKYERQRTELKNNGMYDVDCVLTTRELAKLIRRSGINFAKLPDEEFDQDIMGEYTGAGVIFGATGGVMEAALRTAADTLEGKDLPQFEYEAVRGGKGRKEATVEIRGTKGLKDATININGTEIKVAVASGMKNAKVLMDEIRAGKSPYTFIEIMGCPGGCVNGGGQPYVKPAFLPNEDLDILDKYCDLRAQALYSEDERQTLRQSHKNKQIQALYDDFLGKPNSHKAHELLHTTYHARERFPLK